MVISQQFVNTDWRNIPIYQGVEIHHILTMMKICSILRTDTPYSIKRNVDGLVAEFKFSFKDTGMDRIYGKFTKEAEKDLISKITFVKGCNVLDLSIENEIATVAIN